jgi:3-hydroxyisobutyrate dehydrogenase
VRVAVLGTGIMGAPMARNLAAASLGEVRAWNRSAGKAQALAEDGVAVAASVAEAVDGADAVVVMLSDGDAVRAVLAEALPAMPADAVLVQTSTVGLDATEAIALEAGEHGVAFVDAPVLGTRQPAEAGELVVLASGPDEALDRVAPLFDAIGKATIRLGEAGGGSRLKLVLNAWIVSLTESLAETLALAHSLDVEPARFLETISGGPLDAGYAQLKGKAMAERAFTPASFGLSLALKDARLVLAAAARSELSLPVVDAVAAQMARAEADGHGEEDMAATFLASWPAR